MKAKMLVKRLSRPENLKSTHKDVFLLSYKASSPIQLVPTEATLFQGYGGQHYWLGSFPLTFPLLLRFARGPNTKSVLAWFDKHVNLLSAASSSVPWKVSCTEKTDRLSGLLCCVQPHSSCLE